MAIPPQTRLFAALHSPQEKAETMALTVETLLEENCGKVEQLYEACVAAHEDVTAIDQLGERIEGQFESTSEAARQGLLSLQSTVAVLESAFEQAELQSEQKLQETTQFIAQAEQTCTSLSTQVDQSLTEVKGRLADTETRLEEQLKTAESELDNVLAEADEYQEQVDVAVEAAQQATADFQTKVTTALAGIDEKKTGALSSFDTLRAEAQQLAEELQQAVDNGVEQTQQKLDTTLAAAKSTSDKSANQLKTQLADDSMSALTQQFGDVASTMQAVQTTTDSLGIDLGDSIGEVMDSIEEIMQLVNKIKPIINLVDELL